MMDRSSSWPRFGARIVLLAALICIATAAPSAAIMVKLPSGRYANYDAIAGATTPQIFDVAFSNLDYSGGPVMPSNTDYMVVWQPSNYGAHTGFQTNYIAGVGQFFADMAHDSGRSTNSDAVSTQYNDVAGNTAAYSFTSGGQLTDTDPLPANGCPALSGHICLTDAQIQHELNHFLSGQAHDLAHEYFLLTPPDVASCFDSVGSVCSGNADLNRAYCAYHSMTAAGFVYSNIPDLTGLRGCDPFVTFNAHCPSSTCAYNNGPADGVLSAISHEHNESITDPEPNNAWTDWQVCAPHAPMTCGGEIGDKCNLDSFSDPNLKFGGGSSNEPYNETIGSSGHHYLIQMEWSNQTASCLDSFTPNGTVAHAAFTDTPAGGTAVSFDASASTVTGGAVTEYVWQWDDGPGQTTTQETSSPTISHTFPAPGTYDVALTVMAADGTSNGTAQSVSAGGGGTPHAVFSAPSGLEGTSLTFDGSSSTGTITSYSWNFGDGSPTASGAVVHHKYAKFGNYTATLTVNGSNSVAHTVVVTDEAPTVGVSASPASPEAGSPVSFSASGHDPDGAIVSYQWTFGDGGTASGAGPTHVYTAPGAYNVSVTITDSDGRHVTANGSINVSPDENPTAGLFAASGTAGAPVAFSGFGSDPDGSIVSFTWNFGDGGTGTGATPSHVYAAAGTYTVTVTVTDSAGRTASASEAVTITKISHPLPNCVAPKLKGKTLAKAKRLLKSAHCGLGSVKTPRKPKRSAGHHHKWELLVSHQSVAPGRSKPNGTKISLKLTWAAVKTH